MPCSATTSGQYSPGRSRSGLRHRVLRLFWTQGVFWAKRRRWPKSFLMSLSLCWSSRNGPLRSLRPSGRRSICPIPAVGCSGQTNSYRRKPSSP